MKKIIGILVCILLIFTILPASAYIIVDRTYDSTIFGNTLYVGGSGPGNYTCIQDAIDNASNGDTVYVFSGIYNEFLSIEKSIQLIGEDRDNTIINASNSGDNIKIISDNVVINKFTIQNSQREEYSCIKVLSNNNIIKNVNMIYNSVGINLISSSNNLILNNYFLKNGDGIYSENSNNNLITENIIDNIQFRGIILIKSIENTISYNHIMKSELSVGLQLSDYSSGTHVHHNVISENKHRNIAVYSNDNLIEFNELKFSGMGISMDINSKASYNIIRYNNISFNSLYGIFLEGSQGSMNKIYLNNIFENGRNNIIGGQNNIFDNGYPSGNYWGDYEGVDSDNDGIGDTPYQITNSDDKDNYPLMYPLGSGNLPPFKPKNPYPSNESYNVDIYTSIEWTGGDPNYNDEVTYDIYLGKTNNPSKIVSNHKDNSYYPGPLKYGEKYYWRIISKDKNGITTMGPLWCFWTESIEPIVWVDDDYDNSVDGWQINHFNKIQDGIDAVRQNGIVNVMNGLYSENILIFKSLTLAGENKDNVNIDGYISVKSISNVTLESFKITDAYKLPGITVKDCDSINLSEIIVKDCPDGIALYNSSHCIIENCVCYDNYGYGPVPVAGTGIDIITHSNYNKIISCICYNQTGLGGGFPTGIYVDSSINEIIECNVYNSPIGIRLMGNNNYVNYSYITTHSWDGIEILGSNNEIFNNIILNNDRGILITSGIDNVIYQNNFIDNEKSARFLNDKRLNYWDSNYWDRPRLLPYPIFGSSFSWFFINRVVFDWNPAQEPYDIPIPDVP